MTDLSMLRRTIAQRTLLDHGLHRLNGICHGLGLPERAASMCEVFRSLSSPWGEWPIGLRPRWYPSILSDDHAPYEISVAFHGGTPNTQFYLESQGESPSLVSNMQAGLALLSDIHERYDVSLDRLQAIRDLFLPDDPQGMFTILFGVTWFEGRPPCFKIYLNPQVRGAAASAALLEQAMQRLGFARAWSAVQAHSPARDPSLELPMYLCLDLTSLPEARVKIYRRHYRADGRQLDELARIAASHRSGDASDFYRILSNDAESFLSKPLISSFTFTAANPDWPTSVTFGFPMSSYVENDQVASERIVRLMRSHDLDAERYTKAIASFTERPLDAGNGMHAYVSFKRLNGAPCVTVYLATEAYEFERLQWSDRPAA